MFSESKTRRCLMVLVVLMGFLLVGCSRIVPPPREVFPGESWQTISPEAAGGSADHLERAWRYAGSIGSGPVMVVVHGQVVANWGETDARFHSASVRKSLLSALIGLHVQTGEIHLDSTLEQLGIDDDPPSLTPAEQQATVADLLTSRSAVYHVAEYETEGMTFVRPVRGSHPPGSYYYYNNWDFNALGTIFEQQTHTMIAAEFLSRIARPLQMQDFRAGDVHYVKTGLSRHRAYPFWMSARDLARFGLLYLRMGDWGGRQIIPREWVAESTARHVDGISPASLTQSAVLAAGGLGYGYLWWVENQGRLFPDVTVPPGTYAAEGYGGRYILIVPAHDMVIVQRGASDEPGAHPVGDYQFGQLVSLLLQASGQPGQP